MRLRAVQRKSARKRNSRKRKQQVFPSKPWRTSRLAETACSETKNFWGARRDSLASSPRCPSWPNSRQNCLNFRVRGSRSRTSPKARTQPARSQCGTSRLDSSSRDSSGRQLTSASSGPNRLRASACFNSSSLNTSPGTVSAS